MKKGAVILALCLLLTGCSKTESQTEPQQSEISAEAAAESTAQTVNTEPVIQTESTETVAEAESIPEEEPLLKSAEQVRLEQVILNTVTPVEGNTLLGEAFGDFDADGTDELFAFYGNENGYYKNAVVGELYFASGDSAEKLLNEFEYTSPHTFLAEGDILYTAEEQYVTGSVSRIFAVRESRPVPVEFRFEADMNLHHLDGDEYVAYHSTYDMRDGMGHTWKPYWYYYSREDTAFIPYSAHEITTEQFLEYDGAEQAVELIKSVGVDEYTLLMFDNGVVAANFVVENSNKHYRWRVKDGIIINSDSGGNPMEGMYLIPQDYKR